MKSERIWTAYGWELGEVATVEPDRLRLVATDPSGAQVWRDREAYRVDHPFGVTLRADVEARRFCYEAGPVRATDLPHVIDNFAIPRLIAHVGALVLHAGLVDTPHGAIALTATSGVGKSTLTAGLDREGWTLLGDDAAIVSDCDASPRARPTYRRLSLWTDSAEALLGEIPAKGYKHEVDLLQEGTETRPLRAVFVLEREGLEEPRFRALSPAEAVMAIVANSFALDPTEPAFVRRRLAQAIALQGRVPILAFDYPRRYDAFAEARAALDRLLRDL